MLLLNTIALLLYNNNTKNQLSLAMTASQFIKGHYCNTFIPFFVLAAPEFPSCVLW
jgi:hypothetical protein